MTKRALVVGGGIAGPVTAMALQRAGYEPVIHEAYGAGSDGVGAFLTLAVNGLNALDVLDLRKPVAGIGIETPAMRLVGRGGKDLGRYPMRARTVPRTDLYGLLRDEAERRGVRIEYGKRLTGATIADDGVEAVFADGTTATGDILIGADGLRSRTRTLIDPAAPKARHIGLLNTGGYADKVGLTGEPGVAHFVFGKRCFFGYFIHPDGDVWWFANPPARREPSRTELLAITSEQWRNRLNALFADDDGPMLDIIAATEHIAPGWNTYDFPRVPRWHNDRMVLVGDAVHATSPSSGQGASLAIEDGIVLARCLRDAASPAAGFAAFKSRRRERVEKVVAFGKRSGDGKVQGPVGAYLRDLFTPLFMRRMSVDWMYDYQVEG